MEKIKKTRNYQKRKTYLIQRECPECGLFFNKRADQIARGRGIYCSAKCRNIVGAKELRAMHVEGRNADKKRWAQNQLSIARRTFKIEMPNECSVCNKIGRIHGHHEDYAKPLDIKWLCQSCHSKWHRGSPLF